MAYLQSVCFDRPVAILNSVLVCFFGTYFVTLFLYMVCGIVCLFGDFVTIFFGGLGKIIQGPLQLRVEWKELSNS